MAQADPNVIAILYPVDDTKGYARRAILDPHNSRRFLPAIEPIARESRENTAEVPCTPTVPAGPPNNNIRDGEPAIKLTFDVPPRQHPREGFVMGCNSTLCDILLPKVTYVSNEHCLLTLDHDGRLVLRNFSRNGTRVKFGNRENIFTNTPCILAGDPELDRLQYTIVIRITDSLAFQIVVPNRGPGMGAFQANARDFVQRYTGYDPSSLNTVANSMAVMDANDKNETVLNSVAKPSEAGPIYFEDEIDGVLGHGSFGVVRKSRDAATSIWYACKSPINPRKLDKGDRRMFNKRERELWENEIRLMSTVSHKHIVALHDFRLDPLPMMWLELLEDDVGHLHSVSPFTPVESLATMTQCLSALDYLHKRSITHRDIKPSNFLVASRHPLVIKLADLGCAKEASTMSTISGTPRYRAPELFGYIQYKSTVDIWSLAVVSFEMIYGLEGSVASKGPLWCDEVIRQLNQRHEWNHSDEFLCLLKAHMIVSEVGDRWSAQECLQYINRAQGSPLVPTSSRQTPHPLLKNIDRRVRRRSSRLTQKVGGSSR